MTPAEIKAARMKLGLTQAQLAAALELMPSSGPRTVRNWESGRIAITGPARVAIRMMLALKSAFPTGSVTIEVTPPIQGIDKQ